MLNNEVTAIDLFKHLSSWSDMTECSIERQKESRTIIDLIIELANRWLPEVATRTLIGALRFWIWIYQVLQKPLQEYYMECEREWSESNKNIDKQAINVIGIEYFCSDGI